jgi:xylulokinase
MVDRVGTLPTAAFTISKVAWLAEHEPESFRRLHRMLLPHDYLTFRLTGQYVTDRSEASGTGYYDAARDEYVTEFLDVIDATKPWREMVPRVGGPDEAAGTVHRDALAELGLQGEILVGVGGGDQHATALGLGIVESDIVYSLGTSGVVSALSRVPVRDRSGWVDGVADMTDGFMPLVSTLNAAKVTDAFARILGVGHDELSRLALDAGPRVGPVLAAYLDGERTPNLPDAVGILAGIRSDTTREEVARAAYEGVILGLVAGQRALERAGVATDGDVIVVGGGARSRAYPQLLADLLGRDVLTADVDESTAAGAAVQAAAVARNVTVTRQRDEWRPDRRLLATPRSPRRDPTPMYERVAAVRAADRS